MGHDVVLITGASSGIGLALARVFAREGHDLVLVARRGDELRTVAQELSEAHHVAVTAYALDLTRSGAARALLTFVRRHRFEVDVLVNNAGAMLTGDFQDIALRSHLSLLQLNVVVPTELTHRFLPMMLARGRGRILNVASIAAF